MSRVKKTYHIRRSAAKNPSLDPALSLPVEVEEETSPQETSNGVQGAQLIVDCLSLSFHAPLNTIQRQGVTVNNIGTSAVYLKWLFKHTPTINPNAIKDVKSKFNSHYEHSVIKPNQQFTFVFSFLSEIPGNFTQEIDLVCQPPLSTPIPSLKLTGRALIEDLQHNQRILFIRRLEEEHLKESVRACLQDMVESVRVPKPPLPDVSQIEVAKEEFTRQNKTKGILFNHVIHGWFTELCHETMRRNNRQSWYWDQSVSWLKDQILKIEEEKISIDAEKGVEREQVGGEQSIRHASKKGLMERWEHYCHLSRSRAPRDSPLYETVYEIVYEAVFKLGGEYVDAVRKELDMWEVPFREPLEDDRPEDLKARKEEIDKIKAEWVKRSKKKKWGEEEERDMLNQFRNRLRIMTGDHILSRFTGFEDRAEYIRQKKISKDDKFNRQQYNEFLSRMKTVKQYPLENQKVLYKIDIKLKKNCKEQLHNLQQYLRRKREGQTEKKKASKKKKKEEDVIKPFDFTSILDEQNWSGILQTLKIILQKSPCLLILYCTYHPPQMEETELSSVSCLIEYLKTIEPTIEYITPAQLHTISEGIWVTDSRSDQMRGVFYPEIREYLNGIQALVDVVVTEEMGESALTTYIDRPCIISAAGWKYIALSMRVHPSTIILGGPFTPQTYAFLQTVDERIHLVGEIGLIFYQVQQHGKHRQIQEYVRDILKKGNIVVPVDWRVEGGDGVTEHTELKDVVDLGEKTIDELCRIERGNVFVMGETAVRPNAHDLTHSMYRVLKHLHGVQSQKRKRHAATLSTGINYQEDLVLYLCDANIPLIEKSLFKKQEDVEDEEENNIMSLADFILQDTHKLIKLMAGSFQEGLKDIAKYPKTIEE